MSYSMLLLKLPMMVSISLCGMIAGALSGRRCQTPAGS